MSPRLLSCLYLIGSLISPNLFADEVPSATPITKPRCQDMLEQVIRNYSAQPVADLLVHNAAFVGPIRKGFSRELLLSSHRLLLQEGTFEIAQKENGAIPAADRYEYSRKIWYRDLSRVIHALRETGEPERARLALNAMQAAASRSEELGRLSQSLKNPKGHMFEADVHPDDRSPEAEQKRDEARRIRDEAYRNLPNVIADAETLKDGGPWGKQKDAYAVFIIESLGALTTGLVTPEQMSSAAKSYLVGLVAFLAESDFTRMKTTDFWEEHNEAYTSGIWLVTVAIERFLMAIDHPALKAVIADALQSDFFSDAVKEKISEGIRIGKLTSAKTAGYATIRDRLQRGGEAPDWDGGRLADTALLMAAFWYRLGGLEEVDYQRVLEIHFGSFDGKNPPRQDLLRGHGMLRYKAPYVDPYLHPAYFFPDDEKVPRELTRVDFDVYGRDVRRAFLNRDSGYLSWIFGEDFSPAWSLGVLGAAQAYVRMQTWFPNSPHRNHYRARSEEFFLRSLALVSPGPGNSGTVSTHQAPGVALDGIPVHGFRMPEAISLIRRYEDGRPVATYTLFSPFTQLNWAVAEMRVLFQELHRLEFGSSAEPLLFSRDPDASVGQR